MTYEEALTKAKEMVEKANEIVIVTHEKPTMDSMGSSLAMMLGLISLGKKATVVCPDAITVELSNFVGIDKVVRDFGKKNFVVSLDYVDGSIEKVSYNIEGKKFNLVVEHRPGFEPLSPDRVSYAYQGVSADLIISVDTLNWNQLGSVYQNNKELIASKQVINVDFHDSNVNYGTINLVDPGASSTTELVAELMATLGVKLTTDIATNLLNAVYAATDNFRIPTVTSMAFEVASVCLKAGAARFGMKPVSPVVEQPESEDSSVPAIETPVAPTIPVTSTSNSPEPKIFVNNQPISPGTSPTKIQEEHNAAEPQKVNGTQTNKANQPPSEWLKPKIFKSSGSLV
jgi:nanoRNase/pAp phosphatase (c-di-AMP/oligoRNAs hydrolase)